MSSDFNFDRGNYGIIFYGSTTVPLPTYVDVLGQTRTALLLTDAVANMMSSAISSAYVNVGSASEFDIQVEVDVHGGSSCDLSLVAQSGEASTLSVPDFTPVATFRNDVSPVITKAVHTFSATGKTLLQTANLAGTTVGAISVTPDFNGEDIDVVVKLRVK